MRRWVWRILIAGTLVYLVARYDDSGRVVEIRKILDSKTFFVHEYKYDSKGALEEARITNADGVTSVRRYRDGKPIEAP